MGPRFRGGMTASRGTTDLARPTLIAGNWKMNGTAAALAEIEAMAAAVGDLPDHITVPSARPRR